MNQEKWQSIVDKVKDNFVVIDHGSLDGDIPDEKIEYIEWEMGNKQMRAEAHTKPKLLEKQNIYSNRIGSQTTEQHIYSKDEYVFFVKFYEKQAADDDWREISISDFV